MAEHIFEGIKRPCLAGGNDKADKSKRIHTWRPTSDYAWPDPFSDDVRLLAAPAGKLFFVLSSPNGCKEDFPSIDYWIEHWGWWEVDPRDVSKPIEFDLRFEHVLR